MFYPFGLWQSHADSVGVSVLTVSVPVWRTDRELVGKAVKSVLQNEHVTTVVVTGDGQKPPRVSRDSRVVYFETSKNMGRYFVDDVVSRACQTPLFTVQDADDWQEPERLDVLASTKAVVSYTDRVWTTGYRHTVIPPRPYEGKVSMLWGCMAVYRTSFVRGLWHPNYRVSWDAMLDTIVAVSGVERRYVPGPRYMIVKREESLTTSPQTGMGSPYRLQVKERLNVLFDVLRAQPDLGSVKQVIDADTPDSVRDVRDRDVERLQACL